MAPGALDGVALACTGLIGEAGGMAGDGGVRLGAAVIGADMAGAVDIPGALALASLQPAGAGELAIPAIQAGAAAGVLAVAGAVASSLKRGSIPAVTVLAITGCLQLKGGPRTVRMRGHLLLGHVSTIPTIQRISAGDRISS